MTRETSIVVQVNFDGSGHADVVTGVPFLDHMLDQVARHGMLDLTVRAQGDLHIDGHHTVEDIGITLGQAVRQALGDKAGLARYGHAYVPLDEALSRVVVDLSGRPGLEFHVNFTRAMIGSFDVDLTHEFFQGFANHALVTLHIDNLRGDNAHHQAETVFKAFARALRMAVARDPRAGRVVPSTKGPCSPRSGVFRDCGAGSGVTGLGEDGGLRTANRTDARHRGHRLRNGQSALGGEGPLLRRARAHHRGERGCGHDPRGGAWCCRAKAPCPIASAA